MFCGFIHFYRTFEFIQLFYEFYNNDLIVDPKKVVWVYFFIES
jgi:hypothetical protein